MTWNALVQATNALLVGKGSEEDKIKTHKDRRLSLNSLKLKDQEVKAEGLRDRFGAGECYLHERCFYEGDYLPETIREDLSKVKSYVEDIKEILTS